MARTVGEIQTEITKLSNQIAALTIQRDAQGQRYRDWMALCGNTNSCDSVGKQAISDSNTAYYALNSQINSLNAQLQADNKELGIAISTESNKNLTPEQQAAADAAAAKQKNYRTALIAGIIVVLVVVGIWAYRKFKNKG